MPHISFKNITKSYAHVPVIKGLDAEIADGEFLVLLGPSGCGKSTLLRMIAGLADISGGELLFDGRPANDWTPAERGVAFVFQSYALYPHMTVRENIGFPLAMAGFRKWQHLPLVNAITRARLMNSPEVKAKVAAIAKQLELEPLLERRPAALSGGQRQRVALARALVRDPALYLLDEPLSNLDAKLRTQMRSEISMLHHRVGKTFIYVTHDQVEAMTMASRIIVMNAGVVQQIDTPDGIYNDPANVFVAEFIGAPAMNVIEVKIPDAADQLHLGSKGKWRHAAPRPQAARALLGIRPEKLRLVEAGCGPLPARIASVERLGAEMVVGVTIDPEQAGILESGIEGKILFCRMSEQRALQLGARCALAYDPADSFWFDAQSQARIRI